MSDRKTVGITKGSLVIVEQCTVEIFDDSTEQLDRLLFYACLSALQIEVIVGIPSNPLRLILNSFKLFLELSPAASFLLEDLELVS